MDIPPLFCLHQLLGIWDVSTFWLLWIILLGILTYKFLIILGRCVGVELLNYTVILCLTCLRISNCFPQELYHFTLPPTTYEDSNFSTSFSTLVSFFFFPNRDHPNGCEAASTSLLIKPSMNLILKVLSSLMKGLNYILSDQAQSP